ncbi:MAG: hypothetical protein AB1716_16055 [Planctomycetota bacterium]
MPTELWLTDAGWSLGPPDAPDDLQPLSAPPMKLSPDELTEQLATALAGHEGQVDRLRLVLPSSWCYVHRLSVPQRKPTAAMLGYALEEYLPVEAEALTCAFLRVGTGAYVGVAVETAHVAPLVQALARRDLHVEHITIDVAAAVARYEVGPGLLWCDAEHVALCRADGPERELRVVRLAAGLTDEEWCARIGDYLAPYPSGLQIAGCLSTPRLERLAEQLQGARATKRAVPGEHAFTIDLARGDLAPVELPARLARAWRATAAVLLAALLLVAGGLQLRGQHLRAELAEISDWETALFAQVFPGQAAPAGVALRLASERRRLEGLTLADRTAPLAPDALLSLRTIAAVVPADLRVNVQEVRLEGADLTLRGRLRTHEQAEQLAAAVERSGEFDCAAPRTQRDGDGVQFYLQAQRRPEAPAGPQHPVQFAEVRP